MILGPPPEGPALIVPAASTASTACAVPDVPIILPSAQEVAQAQQSLSNYTPAQFAAILKSVQSLGLAPPAPSPEVQQQIDQQNRQADETVRTYEAASGMTGAAQAPVQPISGTVPAGLGNDCITAPPTAPAPLAPTTQPQPEQPEPAALLETILPVVGVGALLDPPCTSSAGGAVRSADFTKTLAVQAHFRHGGPYTLANVQQALAYLNPNGAGTGVATVRDDTVSSGSDLAAIGAAGYRLDIYQSYNPSGSNAASQSIDMLTPLVQAGYVALLEGPLEVDNGGWGLAVHGGSYTASNGQTYTGYPATAAMTKDLLGAFGDKVPIAAASMANPGNGAAGGALTQGANAVGGVGSIAHMGNVHYYPHNGNPPNVELAGTIAQETGWTNGMPFVMTETGFNDSAGGTNYAGNQLANAAYTLNLILDAFKAGSKLTALYEMFDEPQYDGTGIGFEAHWGLFNADGTPKPSATALHNLMALIGDAGSGAATFASCGAVNYTLSGLPSTGQSLLLQKADGSYDLIIWNDQNVMAGQGASYPVSVNLGGEYAYSVFDPLMGTAAIKSGNGSTVNVDVSTHPVVVHLGSKGAPAPGNGETPIAVGPTPNTSGMGANVAAVQSKYYNANGAIVSGGNVIRVSNGQDLGAAVASAPAGSTILVEPGTYAGGFTATASNVTIISAVPGGAKIVDRGQSAPNKSAVYLKGNGQSVIGFDVDASGGSYWSAPLYTTGSNNTFAVNYIHDVLTTPAGMADNNGHGGGAIVAGTDYGGKNVSIIGNTISNVTPPGTVSSLVHGIYPVMSGTVSDNVVSNVGGVGIHMYHSPTGITVTNNTITGARDGAVVYGSDNGTVGASNITVKNNVITDSSTGVTTYGAVGGGNVVSNNSVQ